MTIKFINGNVIDVINLKVNKHDVVVKNNKIIYVGKNYKGKVDKIVDCKNKWLCPSFIDGHIHIESTMLSPFEFATTAVKHGTCAVVEDPHEITNVSGLKGIDYMLESSKDLPIDVFVMIPSCVPATKFDESKQVLTAQMIRPYLKNPRILGLGELMDFVGAINNDKQILEKIKATKQAHKIIDGHAPGLVGKDLKKYISLGINSDHECSTMNEALQRIKLGMWVMIRQGSAAKNLNQLLPLFDSHPDKCLLVTDDLNAADLLKDGHMDRTIRQAIKSGKDPILTIKLATINAAKCFNLKHYGAIAKDYFANFIILDDLETIKINQVYKDGNLVYAKNKNIKFKQTFVDKYDFNNVCYSMRVKPFKLNDLLVKCNKKALTRVIQVIPGQLITKQKIMLLDYSKNNGIDIKKDILKIVVVERHNNTGHIAIGYINGLGLKQGAIASTVSHDSHNIIAIGCSDKEIMLAIKKIIAIRGGNVIVKNNKVLDYIDFKIGGLMSDKPAIYTANKVDKIRKLVYSLGVKKNIEPFMNMAFISLPVIPSIKITTKGLVDVDNNKLVSLLVNDK